MQLTYRIQKGSHDDFVIDADSGKVSLLRELNYDRKNKYTLEVVAVDGGVPRALSGTATLVIEVLNKKVHVIHELFDMLAEEQKHKHSTMLEWIIIGLITLEVLFFIIHDILKWV